MVAGDGGGGEECMCWCGKVVFVVMEEVLCWYGLSGSRYVEAGDCRRGPGIGGPSGVGGCED